jgi:signal transduction histidine kinase
MADETQRMLDAKRDLLLAISHELRSPLTRAKVATELLETSTQHDNLRRDLNEIEALIEEILETERLSNQHRILNLQPCNLTELMHEVVSTGFAEQAIATDVPTTAVNLSLDPVRLRLLLKNLLDNALRHTPKEAQPPELHLQANAEKVTLLIRDHGSGIEAKHLPHITEPFYRVDPARRRETGGYGLGLYLCRMIAEAHGGALQIDSTVGKGTSITITLPMQTDSQQEDR